MGLLCLGSACVNQSVKSTRVPPLQTPPQPLPESLLLDVGVAVFDAGLDANGGDAKLLHPDLRRAEARYIPWLLADAIQSSGAWGVVRVLPDAARIVDLTVTGTILQSDGATLKLHIVARDAGGAVWLNKPYQSYASRYNYAATRSSFDPFQAIYHLIANDLLQAQQKKSSRQLAQLRVVSELRFAQGFSPEAFTGHLKRSKNGRYRLQRLPADGDPMLARVRKIRERDELFIDTLQEHYGAFHGQMTAPYQVWRQQSYQEAIALQQLKAESRQNIIAGVASVIFGIGAASVGDSPVTRNAGRVAVAAGGYLLKSGLDKRADAELHVEALEELGLSAEAEIAPQIVKLQDQTVTLTGSVQQQYQQWRELLQQIYRTEVGELAPSAAAPPSAAPAPQTGAET